MYCLCNFCLYSELNQAKRQFNVFVCIAQSFIRRSSQEEINPGICYTRSSERRRPHWSQGRSLVLHLFCVSLRDSFDLVSAKPWLYIPVTFECHFRVRNGNKELSFISQLVFVLSRDKYSLLSTCCCLALSVSLLETRVIRWNVTKWGEIQF